MSLRRTAAAARRELSADGTAGYRADIDGLRALAIVLVVVYHVWLGRVSGGVDVFLMISAFFLTASFARRVRRGGRVDVGRFWLRKFRRLLPAAAVTILGTLVAARLAFPETDWPRIWREAWASLFYLENWALALGGVDYYEREVTTASPFQHFWSLSVQGQVFILWPVLIGLIALITRRHRHWALPMLWVVFGVIFVVSLAFSIYETQTSQSFAYFDSRTRLWEFAAGSLVALALPSISMSAVTRVVLGWAGVVGIVICGIVLDVQGGFPGYLALWPVLCTVFVIVAGVQPVSGGPTRFLASKPLRVLGRDAYALYLVHWPVLITWRVLNDNAQPGILSGLAIIGLSFVLARAIGWGVERPLRHARVFDRKAAWGAVVIAASLILVAAPLLTWQGAATARAAQVEAKAAADYPGAAAVSSDADPAPEMPLKPDPIGLSSEWVDLGTPCGDLEPKDPTLEGTCMSNAAAHEPSTPRILVMGDSHAQQMMSPLRVVAEENGWGLVALLKGGCAIGVGAPSRSPSGPPCEDWRTAALDYAAELQPDAVYLVVTRASPDGDEVFIEGIQGIIADFSARGVPVLAVRDNPRFPVDMYGCASAPDQACEIPASPRLVDLSTIARPGSVIPVDFSPWLCPDGVCAPAIGNIAIYLDDNHLTDAYGATLAPMLARMLEDGGFTLPVGR